jgi:hypothetical protein
VAEVALRFGCPKQSKNLKRYLSVYVLCLQRDNPYIMSAKGQGGLFNKMAFFADVQ